MAPVVRRVHQEGERHLEGIRHLMGIEVQFEVRPHQRHHRRHDEGRDGGVGRQAAQHLDVRGRQADLFPGLAQGRGGDVGVFRDRPGRPETPPGPEWVDSCVARSVSSTVGSSRITMGTSTAAWAGTRSVMRGSRRSSGVQAGGLAKRARRACGVEVRCGATAGRPASTPTTGTLRGSNDRSTGGTTALMASTGVAAWS